MFRSTITLCLAMVAALAASSNAAAQCGGCPAPAPVYGGACAPAACAPAACAAAPMFRIQRPIISRPIMSQPCCPAPVPMAAPVFAPQQPTIRRATSTCFDRCISQIMNTDQCRFICGLGGPPPMRVIAPVRGYISPSPGYISPSPGCQPSPAPCQPSCRPRRLIFRSGCR